MRLIKYLIFIAFLLPTFTLANDDSHLQSFPMASWGNGAPELEIKLPNDWTYNRHAGPDFDVHWFSAPNESGSIEVYIGHHPDFKKPDNAKTIEHYVGNQKVTFLFEQSNNRIKMHAIVKEFFQGHSGSGVSELLLHIMIYEHKSGFIEKAIERLKSLEIKASED